MTWTKLSDGFTDRPDLLEVSRSARLLHIEALVYCNKHLRDGSLPRGAVARMTDADDVTADIAQLVAAGVWQAVEGGWQIDWTDQEEAQEVRARQEYRAATQKRYRERKARHERGDHSMCDPRFCRKIVTGNESNNENANETPSPPVPSRPLGRDRDKGAGPGSAGAPPARAAEEEFADELCQHGIKGGLAYRAGSLVCGACEEMNPESLDFIQHWRAYFTAENVTAEEVGDWLSTNISEEIDVSACRLASALYPALDTPSGPVDREVVLYLELNVLSSMVPGCIQQAINRVKDERALEEMSLTRPSLDDLSLAHEGHITYPVHGRTG